MTTTTPVRYTLISALVTVAGCEIATEQDTRTVAEPYDIMEATIPELQAAMSEGYRVERCARHRRRDRRERPRRAAVSDDPGRGCFRKTRLSHGHRAHGSGSGRDGTCVSRRLRAATGAVWGVLCRPTLQRAPIDRACVRIRTGNPAARPAAEYALKWRLPSMVVRDQGGWHNGVSPAPGLALDYRATYVRSDEGKLQDIATFRSRNLNTQ